MDKLLLLDRTINFVNSRGVGILRRVIPNVGREMIPLYHIPVNFIEDEDDPDHEEEDSGYFKLTMIVVYL